MATVGEAAKALAEGKTNEIVNLPDGPLAPPRLTFANKAGQLAFLAKYFLRHHFVQTLDNSRSGFWRQEVYKTWSRDAGKRNNPDLIALLEDFASGKHDDLIVQFALDGAEKDKDGQRTFGEYTHYLDYLKSRVKGRGLINRLLLHDGMNAIVGPYDQTPDDDAEVGDVAQKSRR